MGPHPQLKRLCQTHYVVCSHCTAQNVLARTSSNLSTAGQQQLCHASCDVCSPCMTCNVLASTASGLLLKAYQQQLYQIMLSAAVSLLTMSWQGLLLTWLQHISHSCGKCHVVCNPCIACNVPARTSSNLFTVLEDQHCHTACGLQTAWHVVWLLLMCCGQVR